MGIVLALAYFSPLFLLFELALVSGLPVGREWDLLGTMHKPWAIWRFNREVLDDGSSLALFNLTLASTRIVSPFHFMAAGKSLLFLVILLLLVFYSTRTIHSNGERCHYVMYYSSMVNLCKLMVLLMCEQRGLAGET